LKYDVRRRRGGRRIKKIGREYKIILEGWREEAAGWPAILMRSCDAILLPAIIK
jgi:hypothetical protein